MTLTLYLVLLTGFISGPSKLLILAFYCFGSLFQLFKIFERNLRLCKKEFQIILISILFVFCHFIWLPSSNLEKLLMSVGSLLLVLLSINTLKSYNKLKLSKLLNIITVFILLGDLLHMTGVLGNDMQTYKSMVGFHSLSNLEREVNLSFLGARYYGFFAEPSYHGVFSSLVCLLYFSTGKKKLGASLFLIFFLVCPTPMMVLILTPLLFSSESIRVFNNFHLAMKVSVISALSMIVFGLLYRVVALLSSLDAVSSNNFVNTSEAIRLIYPIIELIKHTRDNGLFAVMNVSCIENITCTKFTYVNPLVTYILFFGIQYLVFLLFITKAFFNLSTFLIVLTMVASSVASGGGAFVPQFIVIYLTLCFSIVKFQGLKHK